MTTGDPDEIHFRQSLDALNFMMSDQHVPQENRVIVRDFYRRSKKLAKRKSYDTLIDACLSRELRGDVRYLMARNLFASVWWLKVRILPHTAPCALLPLHTSVRSPPPHTHTPHTPSHSPPPHHARARSPTPPTPIRTRATALFSDACIA